VNGRPKISTLVSLPRLGRQPVDLGALADLAHLGEQSPQELCVLFPQPAAGHREQASVDELDK
jgi:hypothetical protein